MLKPPKRVRRSMGLAVASLALFAAAAAPASADVRYAEPNGDGSPGTCSQANPCALQNAVEDISVDPGDEVVVLPGIYNLPAGQELVIGDAIDVHGTPGNFSAGRPTIIGNDDDGVIWIDAPGARLADLELDHNDDGANSRRGLLINDQALVERLVVRSPGTDAACFADAADGTIIRDTVCYNDSGAGAGIAIHANDPSATVALRNVTAISNGPNPGILGDSQGSESLNLDVLNSIAAAGAGVSDVVAREQSISAVTTSIVLRNSNYDTASVPPGENGAVTPPGTGTNQAAPPLLTNIEGAFAQLAGSPTIDAGAADALLGSLDILGESRIQGPAPDIGADETANPPNPPDTVAPRLRATAKRKQRGPNVRIKVLCDEPCTTVARGSIVSRDAGARKLKLKLKRARANLPAGERTTLKLKPRGKKNKRKATRALRNGARFKAKIRVTATDAAGNAARDKLRVTLKR